jgi:hypothetical protein
VSKIEASGQKVIVVPVSLLSSPRASGASGWPPSRYDWRQTYPWRLTSTSSRVDSALTTEEPTPCRPPETA